MWNAGIDYVAKGGWYRPKPSGGGGGGTLAFNGTNVHANNNFLTNNQSVTFSTTVTNTIVCASVEYNSGPLVSVTSPSLSWTKGASDFAGSGIDFWYAIASGVLSSEVITATNTNSDYVAISVFAFSGVNTSSPIDGSPVIGDDPLTIGTAATNAAVIAGFRDGSTPSPTAGSGWTQVSGVDYQLVEYQIFTSPQSSVVCTQTTGAGNSNGGYAIAIKA